MDVQNVVESVIRACNTPPLPKTCDALIAGDWHNEVSGIATTFMATVHVIKEAIAKGANLIITHEPTFFTGWDSLEWLKGDVVYQEKLRLIRENNINIWRFHDHMHMTKPDLIFAGLVQELGWEKYHDPLEKHCYIIPKTTARGLSEFLKSKLQVKIPRIVGNMEGSVERVALLVGGGSLGLGREEMPMELMRNARLDLIVCGEILEWTLCAYVRDAYQLGMNKSLIILGHDRTEEIGMKHLPKWLGPLLPDIPIHFIESGEPFEYLWNG
jgi:putative NIF3 family GTP cyclohydrolase 1 type 2